MNSKQFKLWLITNDMSRKQLADRLNVHVRTIDGYVMNDRFPVLFQVALKGLEKECLK